MIIYRKPKTIYEIAEKTDIIKGFPGKEMAKKSLKDFTNILWPFFNETQKSKLNNLTADNIFFTVKIFMDQAEEVFRNTFSNIGFDLDIDKDDNRYIDIHCYYNISDYTIYGFGVDFLPTIKEDSPYAHDAMITILEMFESMGVSLQSQNDGYGDFAYQWIDESIQNNEYADEEEMIDDLGMFCKDLDKWKYYCSRISDPPEVIEMETKPQTAVDNIVHKYFNEVFEFYQRHKDCSIHDYAKDSYSEFWENKDEEDIDGYPIDPTDYILISWMDMDRYSEAIGPMIGEQAGNYGQIDLMKKFKCYTTEEIEKTIDYNEDDNLFPVALTRLISKGQDMYDEIIKQITEERENDE